MKRRIYLTDLTYKNPAGRGSETMPLQIGLIGAYCAREHGPKVEVKLFKYLDDLLQAIYANPPFILGFSNYIWNSDLNAKVIRLVRNQYPDTIIVLGGPDYPDIFEEQVQWLRNHPDADFYIYKDGEVPFSDLTAFLLKTPDVTLAKKAELPSCHALVRGIPFFGKLAPRITDLTQIPSPYTMGLMDKFFSNRLIPVIQTNRGCPFSCNYCTEGGEYYTKVSKTAFERKKEDADYIVTRLRHTKTLRITDSNFGVYSEDTPFCEYLSKLRDQTGFPDYLFCNAGKGKMDRVIRCNEILKGATRLTLSVQSLNEAVLSNIRRRPISWKKIASALESLKYPATNSVSEIILGLPGDSLDAQKETMEGLITAGIGNILQFQLSLIPGAELTTQDNRRKYGIKGMFRPIRRCLGTYRLGNDLFSSVEIEEICVSTHTLSFEDYLEARRLYLTVGLFYNDRIFEEIVALLDLLNLSVWEWIDSLHQGIPDFPPEIRSVYEMFTSDTKNELWETRDALLRDVLPVMEKYESGEMGGAVMYKHRASAITRHFSALHRTVFEHLRQYLALKGLDCEAVVNDMERFSYYRKADILNILQDEIHQFDYNIAKMIESSRNPVSLNGLHTPVKIRFYHTPEQREFIRRQQNVYGSGVKGLVMAMHRFPVKWLYRVAETIYI